MIESLTPEQESYLTVFRKKYLDAGLSTEPANRPRAEDAINAVYRRIGKEPVPIIWVASPLTASILMFIMGNVASLRASLWASLGGSLGDRLWGSLRASKIPAQTTYWWGSMDLYWIAFYQFCAYIGVQYQSETVNGLQIMDEIGKSCGWWYPRDGVCIVCDRPEHISMDQENRLHNDAGPSVQFRDGWKLYYIHGVRVPELVVEHPDHITIDMIDAEENAEVRRVMVERYGQSRYLLDAGAIVLSRDDYGVLLRREVPDDEPIVMVRVLNSTPEAEGSLSTEEAIEIFGADPVLKQVEAMRSQQSFLSSIGIKFLNIIGINEDLRWKDYFLRVPPDMNTAHEAVAWTFGMSVDEYHPDYQS